MKYNSAVAAFIFTFLSAVGISHAQFKFGSDIYSRYIWRGVDYGNAPSFQPAISYTAGEFSIGTWAAYSIGTSRTDLTTGSQSVFAEHDLWASYALSTDAGTFSLLYTDYFYPSAGLKYFNFNGKTGSHVLEIGASYSGQESMPVTASLYYNFHNDADKSVYLQIAYPFTTESGTVTIFAAGTPAKSGWYLTSEAAVINAGLTLSRSVKITESFSLPVNASYILNPHLEQSYLIFGFSL
jgi:hypothetical protein